MSLNVRLTLIVLFVVGFGTFIALDRQPAKPQAHLDDNPPVTCEIDGVRYDTAADCLALLSR